MKILEVIVHIGVFLVLLLAYFAVLKTMVSAPFFVLGVGKALLNGIRHRETGASDYAVLGRVEAFGSATLHLALAVCILATPLCDQSWFSFWQSPIVLVIYFFVSLQFTRHLQGYNPLLRPHAAFSLFSVWPIIATVFLAVLWPSVLHPTSVKWASFSAACVIPIISLIPTLRHAKDMFLFQSLNERHDSLGHHLRRLRHVTNVLGDMEEWSNLQEAFAAADAAYDEALRTLREGKLQQAENAILRGEAELEGLDRLVDDRITFSLKDELGARLEQAKHDCHVLYEEFESAGLPGKDVENMADRVRNLAVELRSIEFTREQLARQLEPFESLFREIIATRTALRLRTNVGASLDDIAGQVTSTGLDISVSKALGIETSTAELSRNALGDRLEGFRRPTFQSTEELIDQYRRLRDAAREHQAAVNGLLAETMKKCAIHCVSELGVTLFVPKDVTTKRATSGAILVKHSDFGEPKSVKCELDGVLLELQERRSFELKSSGASPFTIQPFSLVGKRGGNGRLEVRVWSSALDQEHVKSFSITVATPASETAKDASAFAVPAGGLGVLLFWHFLKDIAVAAPLGVASGGIIGLLIFIFQRFHLQRKKTA